MKSLFLAAALAFVSVAAIAQRAYYVDAFSSSDTENGTITNPFRSLSSLQSQEFAPGDSILLRGNQVFVGSISIGDIISKADKPLVISSYGGGKAQIFSAEKSGVTVSSCRNVVISSLLVKGCGRKAGNRGSGIDVVSTGHVTVSDIEAIGYIKSGINILGGSDIEILRCYAHDNGSCGIHVNNSTRVKDIHNVHVADCIAENNAGNPEVLTNHSGNGILLGHVSNGIVEYCEAMDNGWDMPREGNGPVGIWAYECDRLVIRFCYSHDNKTSLGGKDGGGFDFDGGMTNSRMLYNLSMNNEGAGFGLFQFNGASEWSNNEIKHNVSINDGMKNSQSGFFVWCDENHQQSPLRNSVVAENLSISNQGYGVCFETGAVDGFRFLNNRFVLTDSPKAFVHGDGSESRSFFFGNKFSSDDDSVPVGINDKGIEKVRLNIEIPKKIDVHNLREIINKMLYDALI